ncbi:MAG: T9SS type A sorting domain-containing protein [Saprospiraceae bacterium]
MKKLTYFGVFLSLILFIINHQWSTSHPTSATTTVEDTSKYADFSTYRKKPKKEKAPKLILSEEEKAVSEAKIARYLAQQKSDTATTKRRLGNSTYANGKIAGSWVQQEFQSSATKKQGFRTIYSAYDKAKDKLYVVSNAGHLWRVDRNETNTDKTTWTILNHKEKLMGTSEKRSLHILNLSDLSSRMIRANGSIMQYSNNEGRSWQDAQGINFQNTWDNSGVQDVTDGQRMLALVKADNQIKAVVSTDGINYSAVGTVSNRSRVVEIPNSNNLYVISFENNAVKTFKLTPSTNRLTLINTATVNVPTTGKYRLFGTYANSAVHFYYATQSGIYYSNNEGVSWTRTRSTEVSGSGDRIPRSVDADNPNHIFTGYLDFFISQDRGNSFAGTSHTLGWDMHHMKNYTKSDGSVFHLVGCDFGLFMSYTPSDISTYINLNNHSSHMMIYDADASKYGYSNAGLQDRGSIEFPQTESTSHNNIKSTDGLRVVYANEDKSSWTWLYYGNIFHRSNKGYQEGETVGKNFTGKWWANVLVESPNPNEDAVYIGGYEQLKKFNYDGSRIVETNHPYNFGSQITGFGYSSVDRNRWYVSTKNGDFYYSTNGGNSFTKSNITVQKPIANDAFGTWTRMQHTIKTSKVNPLRVYYVGSGNAMLISNDGGVTFTEHKNDLDIYRFRDISITDNDEYVFAACAWGGMWVYATAEDMWYEMFDDVVPFVDITSVEYLSDQNMVQYSTYGYGMMQLKLESATSLQQFTNVNNAGYQNGNTVEVCSGAEVVLDFGGSFGSDWNFVYTRPDGRTFSGGMNGVERDQIRLPAVQNGGVNEGVWKVTCTDPNGWIATERFTIKVNTATQPELVQYIKVNNGRYQRRNAISVCAGERVILDMGGRFGVNWNFVFTRPDGRQFAGGTNGVDNDQIAFRPNQNSVNEGVWKVTYANPSGCSNTKEFTVAVTSNAMRATLVNEGCQTADIYWNNNGTLRQYGSVKSGETKQQSTYSGHQWVLKVGNRTVGNYTATCTDKTYRFDSSSGSMTATFVNEGCQTADIYWDNNGTLRQYGSVAGGQTKTQRTYGGHKWIFKVGNRVVGNYTADCTKTDYKFDSGSGEVTISLINTGCQMAKIYWDNNGTLRQYGSVAGGQTKTQRTYGGHKWVMKVDNQIVGTYTANCTETAYKFDGGDCTTDCDFKSLSGLALDIGSGGGKTYIVGQGGRIRIWQNNTWTLLSNGGFTAKKIDVTAAGIPWVVATDTRIFYYANNQWINFQGRAKDVGCAGNTVCVIGTDNNIYRKTANSWTRLNPLSSARVDVDKVGNPWVVGTNGLVYQYQNNRWLQKGNLQAKDIGIAEGGNEVWALARSTGKVYRLTESNQWELNNGIARDITVGSGKIVWVVTDGNQIFRSNCYGNENIAGFSAEENHNLNTVSTFETRVLPMTLSPNPASDELRINLSNYRELNVQFTIINLQGKVMERGHFTKDHTDLEVINLQTYETGSYFIHLQPEQHSGVSQKFLVMKN